MRSNSKHSDKDGRMKLSTHPVRTGQARQGLLGNVDMITGSAFLLAPATGRKAGYPADLPVTGGRASAVFGETLCLPAGRQGSTFACLTAETKHLGSDLAPPQAQLLIRIKTHRAGVLRRPRWPGRHP